MTSPYRRKDPNPPQMDQDIQMAWSMIQGLAVNNILFRDHKEFMVQWIKEATEEVVSLMTDLTPEEINFLMVGMQKENFDILVELNKIQILKRSNA